MPPLPADKATGLESRFLEVWVKQVLEEMKNFKAVKALGAQSSLVSGRRKQHDERGRMEVSE